MNREIKFRFWGFFDEYDENRMLYGNEFYFMDEKPIDDLFKGLKKIKVMQYTGLKDFYESDIAQLDYQTIHLRGVIKQQESGEWIIYKDERNFVGFYDNIDRVKKIGNIWENPELIKEKVYG